MCIPEHHLSSWVQKKSHWQLLLAWVFLITSEGMLNHVAPTTLYHLLWQVLFYEEWWKGFDTSAQKTIKHWAYYMRQSLFYGIKTTLPTHLKWHWVNSALYSKLKLRPSKTTAQFQTSEAALNRPMQTDSFTLQILLCSCSRGIISKIIQALIHNSIHFYIWIFYMHSSLPSFLKSMVVSENYYLVSIFKILIVLTKCTKLQLCPIHLIQSSCLPRVCFF